MIAHDPRSPISDVTDVCLVGVDGGTQAKAEGREWNECHLNRNIKCGHQTMALMNILCDLPHNSNRRVGVLLEEDVPRG